MTGQSTGRLKGLLLLALIAGFTTIPYFSSSPYLITLATQVLIWVLLAASWDFLSGYTGQVSFGHGGFFAIGAYSAALLSKEFGWSSWASLPLAMMITGAFGFVVGVPALRVRGHYLALVTLAFAEMTRLVATNWTSLTGGAFGLHDFGTFSNLPTDPIAARQAAFLAVLVIVVLSVSLLFIACERTRLGEIFRAVQEDEVLCRAHGINTTVYKLTAFVVSAVFAGLAGALYAYVVQLVGPALSDPATSAMIIGMAVFGGIGTIIGPALGAFVLFAANEGLRFLGVFYNLIVFGIVIILFVIFLPGGIYGLFEARRRSAVRKDAHLFQGKPETELTKPSSSEAAQP